MKKTRIFAALLAALLLLWLQASYLLRLVVILGALFASQPHSVV